MVAVYMNCLLEHKDTQLGTIDQHYALIMTPLFITQAPTCFGIHMPSSGRWYSKTCLKWNAIVPVFFFRFHRFPFYKGLCFNKTKYKKYDRLGLQ
jgi:hypothetical protein